MRPIPDRLLTLAETAECLGISLRQVRRLIDSGKVPCFAVSERCPRVREADISAYLQSVMLRRQTDSLQ